MATIAIANGVHQIAAQSYQLPILSAQIQFYRSYREALLNSDLNLTDSSFVLLLRRLRGHRAVPRTSGLRYAYEILNHPSLRVPRATYWVMPSLDSAVRNLGWLNNHGHTVGADDCFIAPRSI